ncbi:MAG TPA: reverse transcriptase domain-containing protein [Candidatus Obscuribacterales bacterium]
MEDQIDPSSVAPGKRRMIADPSSPEPLDSPMKESDTPPRQEDTSSGAPPNRRSTRLRNKQQVDYREPDTTLIDQYLNALQENTHTAAHLDTPLPQDDAVNPNRVAHIYDNIKEKDLTAESIKRLPDYALWHAAQMRELRELTALKTWRMVRLPSGRRTIKHKWCFRRKFTETGAIERYKARLVGKGFTQIRGVDFNETFSPVVRHETVRLFLAFCAAHGRQVFQADIGNAYLNAPLEEEVYIDLPAGLADYLRQHPDSLSDMEREYLSSGKAGDLVLLLLKGLPGLRQVGRNWFEMFARWLLGHGFEQCPVDTCLFYTVTRNLIISTHVDDCMFGPEQAALYEELLTRLKADFKVASGSLSWFLGINIIQDPTNGIVMTQEQYTTTILKRFQMHDSRPAASPMVVGANTQEPCTEPFTDIKLFRSAIGSLMHLAKWSCPDIAYAVAFCARAMSKPTQDSWTCVKRIFRYLQGTANHGLRYSYHLDLTLEGHCDSDFANCPTSRKSVSGFIYTVDNGTAPISWKSGNQELVATSTLEAEYIALFTASQEALFLQRLFGYIRDQPPMCVTIKCDNQGAIAVAKNPEFHKRTKHISVKYHAIRERTVLGQITPTYIETSQNRADVFTKPVPPVTIQQLPYLHRPVHVRGEGECQRMDPG